MAAVGELGPGAPMVPDAIVRLASITKPITAAAIMLLVEEGKVRLSDPVSRFISDFAPGVAAPGITGAPLAPPIRAITIHDLLTHQSGLVARGAAHDSVWAAAVDVQDFTRRIARIPLRFQPGAGYEYGPAYEVLAAVVERASGLPFQDFVHDRILRPLQMRDTYFHVPAEARSRLAAQFRATSTGTLGVSRHRGQEEPPGSFYSGGGGLRSTVLDYYRFARLLLRGGEIDGRRLLSLASVRLMTTDHVGSLYGREGYGWGYGMQVKTGQGGTNGQWVGSYGWGGGTGTLFVVDPQLDRVAVVFVPSSPGTPGIMQVKDAFIAAALTTD